MDAVDPDVVLNNILQCLDGPSLASVSCTSKTLNQLISSNSYNLWSNVVYDTWPSLDTPRMRQVISTFPPDGPRSLFSHSYAKPGCFGPLGHCGLVEFVSAVDIRYKGIVVFSKTVETAELETKWFRCSLFRVDLVDQKEVVKITSKVVKHPTTEYECSQMFDDLTLSWILIDPLHGRATNLSGTGKPMSVQCHWLSGEVMVEFCSIFESRTRKKVSLVKCGIRVTLSGSEDGKDIQVTEVSMVMEDMDGKHMNGEGSLVILEMALEGGNKGKGVGYEEFLVRKRERKEREVRMEKRLDLFCVVIGATLLSYVFKLFLLG